MIGTIVNSISIVLGCIIGIIVKGRLSEKISTTVMNGLALCVIYIGIEGAFKGENTLLTIVCIALGALLGEIIDIDKWLNKLGDYLEVKFNKDKEKEAVSISEGFVSASLLFCVGAMAIVGSLQSGLSVNHETLFAKSILDGVSAIIFTSTLGIGVLFSAVSVFLYQGIITILSSSLSGILSTPVINSMTAIGSLLIIGLGLNMLKVTNIKVANLLIAVFLPILAGMINII
ncbi:MULTISPECIES: DUF554 domain-containing protein [unclassified Romboutsia]|uniref:DUF554 domain-containing protein n=1 Tax=unclassified Romboutsia TaxID=2626894 RepID=UPI0018972744|nr:MULTISPECIES: DUF554 domain-containing protein [unclassified Romboutsia]MDB8791968.1 DUF554 domain-containing protein [Romboutsia sp. 1001216sp1]MDB8801513.1 DUF554 domain-containing protein [Romboutsia sp. 1001216sp1]MDB8805143.1 DUF554 domain-containing protein [Romboutsia sp. 1001216sp1]MDB8808883.1 DUF554 domain-containing protein [Romboutsia sp. 1001216sp1]MDB8810788.1 DUF554 domain-containing protein [Romboutsia sp. 1001216sp1]